MDPFQGKLYEPISRHRYQYGNNDPTNNTDPSGLYTLSDIAVTTGIVSTLSFGVQAGYLISRGQADEASMGQALLNLIAQSLVQDFLEGRVVALILKDERLQVYSVQGQIQSARFISSWWSWHAPSL